MLVSRVHSHANHYSDGWKTEKKKQIFLKLNHAAEVQYNLSIYPWIHYYNIWDSSYSRNCSCVILF